MFGLTIKCNTFLNNSVFYSRLYNTHKIIIFNHIDINTKLYFQPLVSECKGKYWIYKNIPRFNIRMKKKHLGCNLNTHEILLHQNLTFL